MSQPAAIIFDLGNVLVDWSPRSFFIENGYSPDESDALLLGPISLDWHSRSDAGLPMAENVRQRILEYPDDEAALQLYLDRWHETIRGPISGTVDVLNQLSARNISLFALTNFPADMYPAFFERFAFMKQFRDIIVSGEVGMKKPDPRIFALAVDRFGTAPSETVFVDDRLENCQSAATLGFQCHHFTTAAALAQDLRARRLL